MWGKRVAGSVCGVSLCLNRESVVLLAKTGIIYSRVCLSGFYRRGSLVCDTIVLSIHVLAIRTPPPLSASLWLLFLEMILSSTQSNPSLVIATLPLRTTHPLLPSHQYATSLHQ